jgi:hypothetical protein
MISTEDIIHETEMDKRIFISYLFPMLVRLLENIENIITDLDNKTRTARVTTTDRKRKDRVLKCISVIPLTTEQIQNELRSHNLTVIILYIKEGLYKVNQQTVPLEDVFTMLDNIYIEPYYFKQCCVDCAENNLGLYIIDIIGAMHLSLSIGYGKPEKYNNVFAFLAWHTLNLFALLGF